MKRFFAVHEKSTRRQKDKLVYISHLKTLKMFRMQINIMPFILQIHFIFKKIIF